MATKEKPPKRDIPARAHRAGPRPLSAEVPAIARAALGRRGFAEAGLLVHWQDIAGRELARMSQPIKIQFWRARSTGGTLTVRCGGAAALEIQHLAPVILERINTYLGHGAITRLKIEQGSGTLTRLKSLILPAATAAETAEIASRLEGVRDDALRDRLQRLGTAMRRRARSKK